MIKGDQPECFSDDLIVAVSSKIDGSMLDKTLGDIHDKRVVAPRRTLCKNSGIPYESTVYQRIVYAPMASYDLIVRVGADDTTRYTNDTHADALVTATPGVGLFLPVADCVATVMYDPVQKILALAHLGRHSTVANLAGKLVDYFIQSGSDPADLIIWMSPHVSAESYILAHFDHKDEESWRPYVKKVPGGYAVDLAGYNQQLFEERGVMESSINASSVDTATHPDYFSHSAGDVYGRFAVVAAIR